VSAPAFPTNAFARIVFADADDADVSVIPDAGFAAQVLNPSAVYGSDPVQFTLSGSATLVWKIDTEALAEALAGKDEDAFSTIVAQFPGIQEAHARVEPFWKSSFPDTPSDIRVVVEEGRE